MYLGRIDNQVTIRGFRVEPAERGRLVESQRNVARSLPAPNGASSTVETFAPRSALEQDLWTIWAEVLQLQHFGVHDNFFALGGNSLLATQVLTRLHGRMKIELSLRTLFDHPRIEALAGAIQRKSGAGPAADDRMHRMPRDTALQVSCAQRRMWLVQHLNPQTGAYNIRVAMRLHGTLDFERLRQAIEYVVQRHEAFRTRFVVVDGELMQVIDSARALDLAFVDLRSLPNEQCEGQARRILSESAAQPFDLSKSGLYRLHVLRLADDEHALFWVMHHMISDRWSHGVVLREIGQAYGALLQGRPPELPALQLEYADYAAWQHSNARGDVLEPQMRYWRDRLSDLEPLVLPYDRPARGRPSGHGSSVRAILSAASLGALKQLSTRRGATPFMTLLACFKLMLARYTGQLDIAVGSPVANRNRLETENLVGSMANTLVLRTDLAGEPSFLDLLARVKETALQAFAHQDVPFERLVEELVIDRTVGRSPLVQVMFNMLNGPLDRADLGSLAISSFDYESVAVQFDLSLAVEPDVSGEVYLAYSTDVFERSSAARMLANYVALIEEALADPDRCIHELGQVGGAERIALQSWNDNAAPIPPEPRVDQLIVTSLAQHAGHTVLRSTTGSLTGAELLSRSTRLANLLRGRGMGRGALVGLCMERSLDMLVAQIAILRCGAAYVPLDPGYPAARLAGMASDAQLALLVAESATLSRLDWPADQRVLLDIDAATIAAQSDTEPAPDATRDARAGDPAYVIYTSGSTGKPKGVAVPHRAVVNFLASMVHEPGLRRGDILVAVTTLSFDIAVLELLAPLTVGAQVVLASRDEAADGRGLRALIESSGATLMQATPSTWRMLVEAGWQGASTFRALVGGEPLPPDLASALMARSGALWNMYGPTETTVWSTCWCVVQPELGITIGRPIANTQVHVLDPHGQLCPIGVVGEIFIGGTGVALGYLHQPELTAERFIADPFNPGGRLYRTGDRGRWRHDGLIEHLGRMDFQVKLRGHRIELGEIEAALARHPQVAQSVVIVRENELGDMRLVAYVVARGTAPAPHALREHLRATLPDYMLPQHYVTIEAMPLLPNGKIQRQGLPPPLADVADADAAMDNLPRTAGERAMALIWQELLGVEQVTLSDNFFDLGGHSVLGMRLVFETEKRLGVKLPLRRLIHETLGQLSTTEADAPLPATAPVKSGRVGRLMSALAYLVRR